MQFAESESQGRGNHLIRHGITKQGRKTLIPFKQIKFISPLDFNNLTIRQLSAYIQLTITIIRKLFEDALVALVMIC